MHPSCHPFGTSAFAARHAYSKSPETDRRVFGSPEPVLNESATKIPGWKKIAVYIESGSFFAKLGSSDLANSWVDWSLLNYIRFVEGIFLLWSSNSRVRTYVSKDTRSCTEWLSQIVVFNWILTVLVPRQMMRGVRGRWLRLGLEASNRLSAHCNCLEGCHGALLCE